MLFVNSTQFGVLNVNPIALRMTKTLGSFGRSECNRVKMQIITIGNHWLSITTTKMLHTVSGAFNLTDRT